MSFREKHLWISIVATIGVWGFYFWSLVQSVMAGRLTDERFTADISVLFMACLVVVVLVEVILTFIATATTPKIERKTRDERELLAALKGSHVALMALITLMFSVAMAAYFAGVVDDNVIGGRAGFSTDGNAMILLANVLVACLVLSEMVRAGVTLALLRGLR